MIRPETLQQVALVYLDAAAVGRTPRRAVQARFHISPATASRWIGRCRLEGLIPDGHAGVNPKYVAVADELGVPVDALVGAVKKYGPLR